MLTIIFPLCWPVQNPLRKPEWDQEVPFVELQGMVGTGYTFVSGEAQMAEPGERRCHASTGTGRPAQHEQKGAGRALPISSARTHAQTQAHLKAAAALG